MKNLMSVDEFIINENNNMIAINEGLLGNIFGAIFKKDMWKDLKGNQSLKPILKSIDDSMKGFTLMKIRKANKCQDVRQAILKYSSDLLEYKLGLLENEKNGEKNKDGETYGTSKRVKSSHVKDKAVADNLEMSEKEIKELCEDEPDLTKWANKIMDSVKYLVNKVVIAEREKNGEDPEKIKKLTKKNDDKLKKLEDDRKKADVDEEKKQKKQLDDIQKARHTMLQKSAGVTNFLTKDVGQAALKKIEGVLSDVKKSLIKENIIKESADEEFDIDLLIVEANGNESKEEKEKRFVDTLKKIFTSDKTVGLSSISKLEKSKLMLAAYYAIAVVYKSVDEQKDAIKELPGESLQAMFAGLTNVICSGLDTNFKLDDDSIELLTRCASVKSEIGYGFPLVDEKAPDDKKATIFSGFINGILQIDKSKNPELFKIIDNLHKKKGGSEEYGNLTINEFQKRILNVVDQIKKKSDELTKKFENEQKAEAKKVEQEENK